MYCPGVIHVREEIERSKEESKTKIVAGICETEASPR